jgi:hypothetical protein
VWKPQGSPDEVESCTAQVEHESTTSKISDGQ